MEEVSPVFPVTSVQVVRLGPPWRRRTELERVVLDSALEVEDYLEEDDTRGEPLRWLEDAEGRLWDVVVDHRSVDPPRFYPRPGFRE